jgi:hypothetical protein
MAMPSANFTGKAFARGIKNIQHTVLGWHRRTEGCGCSLAQSKPARGAPNFFAAGTAMGRPGFRSAVSRRLWRYASNFRFWG